MDAKDAATRSNRPRTLKRKVAARRASPGGIVEIQVPLQGGLKEKDLRRHVPIISYVFCNAKMETKKHAFARRFIRVDPNSVVERRTEIHVEEGCDRRETSAKGSGRKSPVAANSDEISSSNYASDFSLAARRTHVSANIMFLRFVARSSGILSDARSS